MQRHRRGRAALDILVFVMATMLLPGVARQACARAPSTRPALRWSELPPLPDPVGFAGPLVGVSGDALIVAGGANFPKGRPWNGDPKVWYDRIHVLTDPKGSWHVAEARLPRPMAYAVSLTYADGIVCVGGDAGDRHLADAFIMKWTDGGIRIESLPSLPEPIAYSSGAIVGQTIYIAGGTSRPGATEALHTVYVLDLDKPPAEQAWKKVEPWNGPPRMLATAGTHDGVFYLFSGTTLSPGENGAPQRTYLQDAHCYQPGQGWKRLADLPRPAVAAPTPAPVAQATSLLVVGGDDGQNVSRIAQLKDRHPGFATSILAYDTAADAWSDAGAFPTKLGMNPDTDPNGSVWAPVTTGTAMWRGRVVLPSGEVRPGVRTPRVFWGELGGE